MNYDAIIIGLGPAGVSASHYLSIAGYKVLRLGKKDGALFRAEKINNFYGQNDISGAKLFEKGVRNAKKLGANVKFSEVFDVTLNAENFSVSSSIGKFEAKTILIANGVSRNKPKIANLEEYDGNGVSWCAVCDGFLYRKRKVGVLGAGAYAVEEGEYLAGLGCDVTIFTDGEDGIKSKFNTVKNRVEKLVGDDGLDGVVLSSGDTIPVDALFIALGSASSSDFARKIGLETQNGYIKVDDKMQTNCKGVYAAGDCIGGVLQVAKAVSDGAIAGMEMSKYLKSR